MKLLLLFAFPFVPRGRGVGGGSIVSFVTCLEMYACFIQLRTLFRALTTLGSSRGTGATGSKAVASAPSSYLDASGTTSPASDAVW